MHEAAEVILPESLLLAVAAMVDQPSVASRPRNAEFTDAEPRSKGTTL